MKTIRNHTIYTKTISLVLIISFLCSNTLIADNHINSSNKLAPKSRWVSYWEDYKHQLDKGNIDGFIYATRKLEEAIEQNIGKRDFNSSIIGIAKGINLDLERLDYDLSIIIPDNEQLPQLSLKKKNALSDNDTIHIPFLTFRIGEKKRDVAFNLNTQSVNDASLAEIGIHSDLDKNHFNVPGTEKIWIVDLDGYRFEQLKSAIHRILLNLKEEERFKDIVYSEETILYFTNLFYLQDKINHVCKQDLSLGNIIESVFDDDHLYKMIEPLLRNLIEEELELCQRGWILNEKDHSNTITAARNAMGHINNYIEYLNSTYGFSIELLDPLDIIERIVIIPEGYKSQSSSFFGKIFIRHTYLTNNLIESLIHEVLHDKFPGFFYFLNEALTVFFTNKILKHSNVTPKVTLSDAYISAGQLMVSLENLIGEEEIAKLFFTKTKRKRMSKWELALNVANWSKLIGEYGEQILLNRNSDDSLDSIIQRCALESIRETIQTGSDDLDGQRQIFLERIERLAHELIQKALSSFVSQPQKPTVRSHRFPKIIKGQDFHGVFKQNLLVAKFDDEEAARILIEGLKRTTPDGIEEEPTAVKEIARQTLSQILGREVSMFALDQVLDFHEELHEILDPEDAKIVRDHLIEEYGIEKYELLKTYFQNLYGEYHDDLEIMEEIIVTMYTEEILGNPLRLLPDANYPDSILSIYESTGISDFDIALHLKQYKKNQIKLKSAVVKENLDEEHDGLEDDSVRTVAVLTYRSWESTCAILLEYIDTLSPDDAETVFMAALAYYEPNAIQYRRLRDKADIILNENPQLKANYIHLDDFVDRVGGSNFVYDKIKAKRAAESQTESDTAQGQITDRPASMLRTLFNLGKDATRAEIALAALLKPYIDDTNVTNGRGTSGLDHNDLRRNPLVIALSERIRHLMRFYKLTPGDSTKLLQCELEYSHKEDALTMIFGFDQKALDERRLRVTKSDIEETTIDIKIIFHNNCAEISLIYEFSKTKRVIPLGIEFFDKPLAKMTDPESVTIANIVNRITPYLCKEIRQVHNNYGFPVHTGFHMKLFKKFIGELTALAETTGALDPTYLGSLEFWQSRGYEDEEAYYLVDMFLDCYDSIWYLFLSKFKQTYTGWQHGENFHVMQGLFTKDALQQLLDYFDKLKERGIINYLQSITNNDDWVGLSFKALFDSQIYTIKHFYGIEYTVDHHLADILKNLTSFDDDELSDFVETLPESFESAIETVRTMESSPDTACNTPEQSLILDLYKYRSTCETHHIPVQYTNFLNLLMNNMLYAKYIADIYRYRFSNNVNILRFINGLFGASTNDFFIGEDLHKYLLNAFAENISGFHDTGVIQETRSSALKILGLEDSSDLKGSDVKTAYRKIAIVNHPDRAIHRITREAQKLGLSDIDTETFIKDEMGKAEDRFKEAAAAFEFLDSDMSRKSDSTWIYRNDGTTEPIPEIEREYLEQSAHNYLEKAGEEKRIIRVYGTGVQANIYTLVKKYCVANNLEKDGLEMQKILEDLQRVTEYITDNANDIGFQDNILIGVVLPSSNETEPIGFSHINNSNDPSFMAVTAIGGRFRRYQGADTLLDQEKTPYTIYMRLDDLFNYIELGEEWQKALIEKLKHECKDATRKLAGDTDERHIDETAQITRQINNAERQILENRQIQPYHEALTEIVEKLKTANLPDPEYKKILDSANMLALSYLLDPIVIFEQLLLNSNIHISACIQIVRYIYFAERTANTVGNNVIRKSTITAIGMLFTRPDLTDPDICTEIVTALSNINTSRENLRSHIVKTLEKALKHKKTNNQSIEIIGNCLYGIRTAYPVHISQSTIDAYVEVLRRTDLTNDNYLLLLNFIFGIIITIPRLSLYSLNSLKNIMTSKGMSHNTYGYTTFTLIALVKHKPELKNEICDIFENILKDSDADINACFAILHNIEQKSTHQPADITFTYKESMITAIGQCLLNRENHANCAAYALDVMEIIANKMPTLKDTIAQTLYIVSSQVESGHIKRLIRGCLGLISRAAQPPERAIDQSI